MFISFCTGLLIGSKLFSLCLQDYAILQIAFLFGGLSNMFLAWAPTTALFFLGNVTSRDL